MMSLESTVCPSARSHDSSASLIAPAVEKRSLGSGAMAFAKMSLSPWGTSGSS